MFLVAFNIFFFEKFLWSIWLLCALVSFCLGLYCVGFCVSWTECLFFSHVREDFSHFFFKCFRFFVSLPSLGGPIMLMLAHLTLSQRSIKLSSFHSFFLLFHSSDFPHLSSSSLYLFLYHSPAIDSLIVYFFFICCYHCSSVLLTPLALCKHILSPLPVPPFLSSWINSFTIISKFFFSQIAYLHFT